jgi:homoserine kinase type II
MAVFTPISDTLARELLADYTLGELRGLQGIAHGIENTNYFLDTDQGRFVLTVFERLSFSELPYYIELMRHLAERQVLVPAPQTRRDGQRLSTVSGKPAAIVSCLKGKWIPDPSPEHCEQVGVALARMHLAGTDFPIEQPNLRGLPWWEATVPRIVPHLDGRLAELLQSELAVQQAFGRSALQAALPRGPVHADLFRDNVLFETGPRLGGFIDFYFAGHDTWLFDLAVAVNDWCVDLSTGVFDQARLQAFVSAYARIRPFTEAEREAWPMCLRAGAYRFWVSRLFDWYLPRPAQTLTPHDPRHFERILRERIDHAAQCLLP